MMDLFENDLGRSVLSDSTIMAYNRQGLLIEEQIQENQLQPNSVDLTLSASVSLVRPNDHIHCQDIINPRLSIEFEKTEFTDEKLANVELPDGLKWFLLKPNSFCLMSSNETLNIPNGIISFVQGRSSVARLGIQIEQAGLIDAGFRGNITFECTNFSDYPVLLFEGMRIAQVYFFQAQYANKLYGAANHSKYEGQTGATESRIHLDRDQWTQ